MLMDYSIGFQRRLQDRNISRQQEKISLCLKMNLDDYD